MIIICHNSTHPNALNPKPVLQGSRLRVWGLGQDSVSEFRWACGDSNAVQDHCEKMAYRLIDHYNIIMSE